MHRWIIHSLPAAGIYTVIECMQIQNFLLRSECSDNYSISSSSGSNVQDEPADSLPEYNDNNDTSPTVSDTSLTDVSSTSISDVPSLTDVSSTSISDVPSLTDVSSTSISDVPDGSDYV